MYSKYFIVLFRLQQGKFKIFCEDCKLAATPGFFWGFGPCFCVHLVHCSCQSCSLYGFFHYFWHFEIFFELVFHSHCIWGIIAVPIQTGVRYFSWAKTNNIITKHMYTRQLAFSTICNRSFLILVVVILYCVWPAWSRCKMTCFCNITGTRIQQWFILFTNTTLNGFGFGMLNVEHHSLHFITRPNLAWSYSVASNDCSFFGFDIPWKNFKLISISKPISWHSQVQKWFPFKRDVS